MSAIAVADPPREIVAKTLFDTDDPLIVVQSSMRVATALADIIEQRQLFVTIRRKRHIVFEGWTLLGSMLGVFADVEWSRPIYSDAAASPRANGFEARAVAHTLAGRRLGAVDSQCTREEDRWADAQDYAIRSMAQTRAMSKALRGPLGFIVELAGYAATPAEEMTIEEQPKPTRVTALELREEVEAARLLRGISDDQLAEIAKLAGVEGRANVRQLRAILAAVEQVPYSEETTDDESDEQPEIAY